MYGPLSPSHKCSEERHADTSTREERLRLARWALAVSAQSSRLLPPGRTAVTARDLLQTDGEKDGEKDQLLANREQLFLAPADVTQRGEAYSVREHTAITYFIRK